jgi:hypothetical protein
MACLSDAALSATVSSQSSLGVSSEYASNPFLQPSGAMSAEALALVADLPATYTSDTQTIDLIPSFRLAQTYGPVAVLTNYGYLDADWQWKSSRNTFSASGKWHHDSTYYDQFEQADLLGHDLARLEEGADLSWDRSLTERANLQVAASWDRLAYSQRSASSSVSNYTYSQASLQYVQLLRERMQLSGTLGYGRFELSNGTYLSDERFAQAALQRNLSERWSLQAQVGYAYLTAHGLSYSCCQLAIMPDGELYLAPIPVTLYTGHGAPNFMFGVQEKGERLQFGLSASRAIEPSGLGALITADSVGVDASLSETQRLTLEAGLNWARISDLLGRLSLEDQHHYTASLSADWLWTEKWTLQWRGSFTQNYTASRLPAARGVTIYVNLLRRFGRLPL